MPAANDTTDEELVESSLKHSASSKRPDNAPSIMWMRSNLAIGYTRAKRIQDLTQDVLDVGHGSIEAEPTMTEEDDHIHITSQSKEHLITPEQLMEMMEIDQTAWQPVKTEVKTWPVVTKDCDGEPVVTQVYYTRVVLEPIPGAANLTALFEHQIEQMRSLSCPAAAPPACICGDRLFLVSVPDAHFGKLAWSEETGQSWNTQIAYDTYISTVSRLIAQANLTGVDSVAYVVGNDLLHVDSGKNQTTAGTPQDVDGRWQYAYNSAYDAVVKTTQMLAEIAPVKMYIQPGNHDRERAYTIGHSLCAFFHANKYVDIDNSPTPRKYLNYGHVLLGFAHGDQEKIQDLPMLMAAEKTENWVNARYKEWLIGHTHRKKTLRFLSMDEIKGVRVRTLPSLTATDSWHTSKGFSSNNRSAEAIVYSADGLSVDTYEALLA